MRLREVRREVREMPVLRGDPHGPPRRRRCRPARVPRLAQVQGLPARHAGQGRSFGRRTAGFWEVWPMPAADGARSRKRPLTPTFGTRSPRRYPGVLSSYLSLKSLDIRKPPISRVQEMGGSSHGVRPFDLYGRSLYSSRLRPAAVDAAKARAPSAATAPAALMPASPV